MYITEKPR